MTDSRIPLGAKLSAAGAALLLTSLWLPWYQITFPQAFRDALGKLGGAGQATTGAPPSTQGIGGAVNALVAGLATAIPDKIAATGWQAMKGGDVALAVIVGLVAILLTRGFGVLRMEEEPRAQALAALGLVAVGIVGYHVLRRPFGDLPGFVEAPSLRYGLAMAMAGAVLIGIGGHLLGRDAAPERIVAADDLQPYEAPDEGLTPLYQPPAPGTSVAPPGLG
jgi:hypothetical protein